MYTYICLPAETSICRHLIHLANYHCTCPQLLSMKRTGAALNTRSSDDAEVSKKKAGDHEDDLYNQSECSKPPKIVQVKNIKQEGLKMKLKSGKTDDFCGSQISSQTSKTIKENQKNKLNLRNLRNRAKKNEEELKPNVPPGKNKPRAVVNLESMKEELKQLLDPPISSKEKELSSARLDYSFFDTACEQLAQNLLGKVLVRHLENGTILKGRIVETEGYLGAIDKASQTYQYRVTPRNLPMYMPPGTVYVYMTYGMYHCFNISSQEPGSFVRVNALEPLIGIDYMELLRNMQPEENGRQKKIAKNVRHITRYQLCNSPTKVCTALDIDCDQFDGDGCAVLIRAVEPLEGIDHMTAHRSKKSKGKKSAATAKTFQPHELCNGPSKLCMAYELERSHSKYSMCSWRGLWLENDSMEEEIEIVRSTRIGIDSCGSEWASKPLRYYIYGNKCVSKRDRKAEELVRLK